MSTIIIRKKDAIRKIAEIVGAKNIEEETSENENRLLANILTRLTEGNTHIEFRDNNFMVVENDYTPRDEWDEVYEDKSMAILGTLLIFGPERSKI